MTKRTLVQIKAEMAKLQQEADEVIKQEFDSVLAEVKEKISNYGFTAKDLGFVSSEENIAQKEKSSKVTPKYQKGEETWSGRGRQPKWIQAHLASGGNLEDLLIQK